ncbi:hypothetical protein ACWCPS_30990 [Streptomyces mauvecolor]
MTDPDGLTARLNELGGVRAALMLCPYHHATGHFTAPQNALAVVEALAEHSGQIVLSSSHSLREGTPATTHNAPLMRTSTTHWRTGAGLGGALDNPAARACQPI